MYPLLLCLHRPRFVFTGKCAIMSLRTSDGGGPMVSWQGGLTSVEDGLFWGSKGLRDLTVCVNVFVYLEDGVILCVFTRMREDASCAWNCLLFSISFLVIFRVTARWWCARRCKCTSGGISWGTCTWQQMNPTNPRLPCVCCSYQQCKASQHQSWFWWFCPSVESSAQVLTQQRMTQVWPLCCHTILQRICCGSSPLGHQSFLFHFFKLYSSSRLQLGRRTCLALPT